MIARRGTDPRTQPVEMGPVEMLTDRRCESCGQGLPAFAGFCPRCGVQAGEVCGGCAGVLPKGAAYCCWCGLPAGSREPETCPGCGALRRGPGGYCSGCGTAVRAVCGECDHVLQPSWAHCPHCGHEAPETEQPAPAAPQPFRAHLPREREAEMLNDRGAVAYEAGQHHEAARLFREATLADASNPQYFANLAVAYGELGDDLQAFAAYRRVLELDPANTAAYLNMGYLYNERERFSEARDAWEKVVLLDPDGPDATEARENLASMEEV